MKKKMLASLRRRRMLAHSKMRALRFTPCSFDLKFKIAFDIEL